MFDDVAEVVWAKRLKSLDEFNAGRRDHYARLAREQMPHPNGIACPQCGAELWDSNPTLTLTSNPPQKHVHCPACGHRGFRIA